MMTIEISYAKETNDTTKNNKKPNSKKQSFKVVKTNQKKNKIKTKQKQLNSKQWFASGIIDQIQWSIFISFAFYIVYKFIHSLTLV